MAAKCGSRPQAPIFLLVAASLLRPCLAASAQSASPSADILLSGDDECLSAAAGADDCSLSALQLRSAPRRQPQGAADPGGGGTPPDADEDHIAARVATEAAVEHLDPVAMAAERVAAEALLDDPQFRAEAQGIQHYALECRGPCGKAGFCDDFCGMGNACCRKGWRGDPEECQQVGFWPVLTFHTCVKTTVLEDTTTTTTTTAAATAVDGADDADAGDAVQATTPSPEEEAKMIMHYGKDCWIPCGRAAGFCESYCGAGNACCRYLRSSDPAECHYVKNWPLLNVHTCVRTWAQGGGASAAPSPSGPHPPLDFSSSSLFEPSTAPLMTFYMYRVQSDENYDPNNQNMGNLPGILWYMHNEIVYHPRLQRSGSYFSTSKTRIERFKVHVKATQPLFNLGMNFGVVNTFDSSRCTGPYDCTKTFRKYGYVVGCETWEAGSPSAFPHGQWVGKNVYPGAMWYSLPGPCPTKSLKEKDRQCMATQPGGSCTSEGPPTGAGDCTYNYEKVGEISIDELEGLANPQRFVALGGREYDWHTDMGTYMSFWNQKGNPTACQRRVDFAKALFKKKYPDQPDLPDPKCDFNQKTFFENI